MSEQFEHKVHEMLGDIELEPRIAVWQKVQERIQPEKKRRRFIFWWLLPVVIAGGALTYYFTGDSGAEQSIAQNHTSTANNVSGITPDHSSSSVTQENSTTSIRTADDDEKQQTVLTSFPVRSSTKSIKVKQQDSFDKNRLSFNSASVKSNTSAPVDQSKQTVAIKKTIQDGETASIAVQTIDLGKKDDEKRDYNIEDNATVKKKEMLKPKKWRFGISADGGIANVVAVQNNNYSPVLSNGNISSGSPFTGGSFGQLKQKQQTFAGAQFGLGAIVQRRINRTIDVFTALSYQYQSFAVKDIIYKDSANLQVVNYSNTANYSMHYMNLSFGVNLYLLNKGKKQFGITTAFDNMHLLTSNTNVAMLNAGVASLQKDNSGTDFKKWQPNLRLGFVGSFNTSNNQLLQVTPYMGYGLNTFKRKAGSNQHVWQLGLNVKWYFK